MHGPLRTQSSRTRPGWGSCYARLLAVHSGRSIYMVEPACLHFINTEPGPNLPFANEGTPLF